MKSKSLPILPARATNVVLSIAANAADDSLPSWNGSGGAMDFIRPWTQCAYRISHEQVARSSGKLKFKFRGGGPVLLKLPAVDLIDDKEGKPIGIQSHIGRRPIFESEMNPENTKGYT